MWRVVSIAFALLMSCVVACAADAVRSPDTFSVAIERQPLAGALQQLARQCDVQVIFFSRVTQGLSAPAIDGQYTLPAALEQLLAGSGLTFTVIDPQTVEVRPAQARVVARSPSRGATTMMSSVASSEKQASLEEVVVVGLAEQLVATRIATPLRDIPQSISLISAAQMRQGNDVTLADVLARAPGVTSARTTSLDAEYYARGYQITSFHVDGGAAINPRLDAYHLFLGSPDLVEFDHVELLRGADGLFSGNANPGATVSLVRKRPQRNFEFAFNSSLGSWNDGRVEVDVTGPIARDGALRGRAAAVYDRSGYFYDIDAHERWKVFGALEYDLAAAGTLTAGVSYQWDHASGVGNGLPVYGNGNDPGFSRDTALEFDWSRYRNELGGAYAQYRHQLAPEWLVKLNASGWRTEAQFGYGYFGGFVDPVTHVLNDRPDAAFSSRPHVHTQNTIDVTLTGTLDWFGWREELAVGADATRVEIRSYDAGYFNFGAPLRYVAAFDPADYPDPRVGSPPNFERIGSSDLDQYGVFASLRIYFDDAWSIVGGARVSRDSTSRRTFQRNGTRQDAIATRFGSRSVLTPYAGLMYALGPRYSLYASYTDIYRAQSANLERSPGNRLEPVNGVNLEAGIKAEWRNGSLNGSLALYRIEQSHLPTSISSSPRPVGLELPLCCYGGVSSESRGVDAELSGELAPGWNVGLGYSFNINESPQRETLSPITPKHLFKGWTDVRLPGDWRRWHIGGGVHAQSKTRSIRSRTVFCPTGSTFCTPVRSRQPGYAVVDLRVGFDLEPNWQISLGLNNVLDKVYYESLGATDLRVWYGPPRNWTLRIDARY